MMERVLGLIGAIITGYTMLDALCYMISGSSLSENIFGGGSPVSEAILQMVPGMTPAQFLMANIAAIVAVSVIMVACIWYCLGYGEMDYE